MKKGKLSFKRIALVASLALAGLFGVSSILCNKISEENLTKQAYASAPDVDDSDPIYELVNGVQYRIIYFHVNSSWEYSKHFGTGSYNWCYSYSADNSSGSYVSPISFGQSSSDSFNEILGDYVAKIYLPVTGANWVVFRSVTSGTDTRQITSTYNITTKGQAFWVYRDVYTEKVQDGGEWISKTQFLNRFYNMKFSVTSDWHKESYATGNQALISDWIHCEYSSGNKTLDGTTNIFKEKTYRYTKVVENMLRQFEDGRYYAEFLVPKDCTHMQMVDARGNKNGPSGATWQDPVAGKDYYYVNTNVGTWSVTSPTQTGVYTAFPEQSSDYDLVGNGSFLTNTDYPWSYLGGINMKSDDSDHGVLTNQYLVAGDIFQLKNRAGDDSSYWYGYSKYQSGGTNFSASILSENGGKVTCKVIPQGHWTQDSPQTRIVTSGSPISAHNETIIVNSGEQEFEIWSDVTTLTFNRHGSDWDANYIYNVEVPSDWSQSYQWYLNDGSGDWNFQAYRANYITGNNIKVNTTGFYNIYLNSSNDIYISNSLGEELYLDLGPAYSDWTAASAVVGAYFWIHDDSSGTDSVENATSYMTPVKGCGNTTTYEALVPKLSIGMPNRVVFFRANPSNLSTWWNQTQDQTIIPNKNRYLLNGQQGTYGDDTGKYLGSWDSLVSYQNRADWFGTFLLSADGLQCYNGESLPTNWIPTHAQYDPMGDGAKDIVFKANANISGTAIEQGMARYDLVISKYGTDNYPDYLNRMESNSGSALLHNFPNVSRFNPFSFEDKSSTTTVLIVIASSVSVLSITALSVLLVKKHKTKEQ